MRFWDSCALSPLYVAEARTAELEELERADPFIQVWWGTQVEVISAIFKKVRGGLVSHSDGMALASRIQGDFEVLYAPIEPSQAILLRATKLVRDHNLGAADALQLAAFLESGLCQEFVTLDRRLRDAALGEGAVVLP